MVDILALSCANAIQNGQFTVTGSWLSRVRDTLCIT